MKSSLRSDFGQSLVEYALILALIAIVAIAVLGLMGGNVSSALSTVSSGFGAGAGGGGGGGSN